MQSGPRRFPTTRWSRVLAAGGSGDGATSALTTLYESYRYPLYAFARRKGRDHQRAEDTTQAFFTRLLEKRDLGAPSPQRGRFRSWLLAAFRNFMANEHNAVNADKRDGGKEHVSFEDRYAGEPTGFDAEALFDRRWAVRVLERAFAALRESARDTEQLAVFERLKSALPRPSLDEGELGPLAAELASEPGKLKTQLSRHRDLFWELVRSEIAETLEDPNDVDDELRHLIKILGAAWS